MIFEKSRNSKRNIAVGIRNKFILLFMPFLVRAVMIRVIGMEYVGINGLFTSILTVLNLSELGFGNAVVYCLYNPIANDDQEMICAWLAFLRKVYFIVGTILLVVGLSVMPFLQLIINGEVPNDINIYIVYLIYLFNTAIGYFLYAYKEVILIAYQRQDIYSNIRTSVLSLIYVLQIVVLVMLKNYYCYVILMCISTIAISFLVSFETKRRFPKSVCVGKIQDEERKKVIVKVRGLLINKLCQTTRNSCDSLFITAFLGLSITGIYNNYYDIILAITSFFMIFITSINGGAGNSVETENVHKVYSDFRKLSTLYLVLAGWVTILLICFFQDAIALWVGSSNLFPFLTALLLAIYFLILKLSDVRGAYIDAFGIWWENRNRTIFETAANILLNYVLGKYLGINGIIIASIMSVFIINYIWGNIIFYTNCFPNEKMKPYVIEQMLIVSATIIIGLGCISLSNYFGGESYFLVIVIRIVLCICIPMGVLGWIYRKNGTFSTYIKWMCRIVFSKYGGTAVK